MGSQIFAKKQLMLAALRDLSDGLACERTVEHCQAMERLKLGLCSLIRETLALVVAEWGPTWRWGSAIQKVDRAIWEFEQLFDVTTLDVQDATEIDWHRLLGQVQQSNAWCTLKEIMTSHCRKSRPSAVSRKELLPHVKRSGKVAWTQQERGGRCKPGEATNTAGDDVPLAPAAVIMEEVPESVEDTERELL